MRIGWALVLAVLAAGCAAPAHSPMSAKKEVLEAMGEIPMATPGTNSSKEDWWVLAGQAGPRGPLVAAEWTIPVGAVVPPESADRSSTLYLEFAPLLPPDVNATLEESMLVIARMQTIPVGRGGPDTNEWISATTPGALNGERWRVEARPWVKEVWDVHDGDRLGLVWGVRSGVPGAVGLAFRVRDASQENASANLEAFRAAVADRPPLRLPETGRGEGFSAGYYFLSEMPRYRLEIRTDAVRVQTEFDEAVADAQISNRTYSVDFPSASGWGDGVGAYITDPSASRWRIEADVHGQRVAAAGASLTGGPDPFLLLYGVPIYWVTGDGPGPTRVRFQVEEATAAPEFRGMILLQFDLGSTMHDLFGIDWPERADRFSGGLPGPMPQVQFVPGGSPRFETVWQWP